MNEQIYIDGQLFELSAEGEGVELVFQSPFFTDIENIVSNRTNEVIFPLTAHNRRAMKLAGITTPESSALYAYRKHTASYWRDGVHIFDGQATLLSWSATTVSFVLTWGNSDAFQKLVDGKLQDLPEVYVPFGFMGASTAQYIPYNLSFGMGTPKEIAKTWSTYIHPCLKTDTILQAIEDYTGVSGLVGQFENSIVPLLTKKTDATTNRLQAPHFLAGGWGDNGYADVGDTYNAYLTIGEGDTDYVGIVSNKDDGDKAVFDVQGKNTIRLYQTGQLRVYVDIDDTNNQGKFSGVLGIFAVDEDGNNGVEIATIEPTTTTSGGYTDNGNPHWTYGYIFNGFVKDVDVSDYGYIAIRLVHNTKTLSTTHVNSGGMVVPSYNIATIGAINMQVVPDINEPQEVVYIGDESIANYPLYANLPDMTLAQFVKNIMQMQGYFANVRSADTISLATVDSLYNNRAVAYDWTQRLIGEPTEIAPTFEDYAQRNTLRYAEDDTVEGNYDGVLLVDNTTLEDEAELIELDFAATDTRADGSVEIPIYTEGVGGEVSYDSGLTPRILRWAELGRFGYLDLYALFRGLSFESIVATYYSTYQDTINRPVVLTVDVAIDTLELANIDLAVPCYLAQTGHYYAIMNLTTKDGKRATAQLLQLADNA